MSKNIGAKRIACRASRCARRQARTARRRQLLFEGLEDRRLLAGLPPLGTEIVLLGAGEHLDLTDGTHGHLTDVVSIDIRGTGGNILTLDAPSVEAITDANNKLVIRHDRDDSVHYLGQWNLEDPVFPGGECRHSVTSGGVQLEIANTTPWQSPLAPLDANCNCGLEPVDLLLTIDSLNDEGPRALPMPVSPETAPDFYYDADGTNTLTAADLLSRITGLNRQAGQSGEGEVDVALEAIVDEAATESPARDTLTWIDINQPPRHRSTGSSGLVAESAGNSVMSAQDIAFASAESVDTAMNDVSRSGEISNAEWRSTRSDAERVGRSLDAIGDSWLFMSDGIVCPGLL